MRCEGDARYFIMRIRENALEGELAFEKLRSLIMDRLDKVKKALAQRDAQLAQNVSLQFMTDWLLLVRGLI